MYSQLEKELISEHLRVYDIETRYGVRLVVHKVNDNKQPYVSRSDPSVLVWTRKKLTKKDRKEILGMYDKFYRDYVNSSKK